MGSGKTTHGKKLAPLFNLPFIDLDTFIEQHEKQSIQSMFETDGEKKFRETETKHLGHILNTQPASVISLGGGTPCFNNNLDLIKKSGLLVFIELPLRVLMDRLSQSTQNRPLFSSINEDTRLQKMQELYNERLKYYTRAHITINGINLTPKILYTQIVEFIQK